MPQSFDVCIVGSGPGGGIASYVLAGAGFKVALVEAGRRLRAGVDYSEHGSAYAQIDERLKAGHRSPFPGLHDFSEKNHFTPVGDRPGHGLLKALGGRSLCWAGHSLRFGPGDFKRWPISYEEVAPYYDRAERLMGVYGSKDGLWNMPDGVFQKTVPMRCPEMLLKRGVLRLKAKGRTMDFVTQRKAIPTDPAWGRRATCHYCGQCMNGCDIDSKYTSANTPIPLALRTGNLTLLTESTMTRILMDEDRRRVSGIEFVNSKGNAENLRCKTLVLACSTVETARQLLIANLANSSGQVGKNLTSHFGTSVVAMFPELRNRDASNDDGTDYFHSLLTGLYWDKPSPDFDMTYQVQCAAGVNPRSLAIRNVAGYGSAFKRELRFANICHALMNMQGSLKASPETFVDLDPDRKDRNGLPLPRVHLKYGANDIAMAKDMVETCAEIIHAAGGEVYSRPEAITPENLQIDYNHWVGTVKMGTDPKHSVVNRFGQAHDVPNLFVGDSSVFAAYPEKNPTLTNIALSWRMSEHLAEKAKKGELG
ncbi:MAG: GMC family oxidoreductase [Bryobacteraceae bacterium]